MPLNATECDGLPPIASERPTNCHELRLMYQAERNAFVRAMQTLQYHSSWQGSTIAVSYVPHSSGDYEPLPCMHVLTTTPPLPHR